MEIEGFISLGTALSRVLDKLGEARSVGVRQPQLCAALAVQAAQGLRFSNAKNGGNSGSVETLPEQ